jgi:CRISPR-associated exonuclease Cas4
MDEPDPIPLSALQHFLFCPRQCALIHVERLWAENVATVEGKLQHERSDRPGRASRGARRTVYAMPVRSTALGIAGVADVVELTREGKGWRALPVEHKRGRPKAHRADEVQLCAQGLCLEEMLGTPVPAGALFYGRTRRRLDVALDEDLRALTRRVVAETRAMIEAGRTPAPIYEKKRCEACSLRELCRPERLARGAGVARWLAARIAEAAPP